MNRRKFITAAAAYTTMISTTASHAANNLFADNIVTDMDYAYRDDTYATLAILGKYKKAKAPYRIKINNGDLEDCMIYVSPNVDVAKLIVFSHNLISDPTIFRNYFEYLTSHGYAIVAPIHNDISVLRSATNQAANSSIISGNLNNSDLQISLADNNELYEKRVSQCLQILDVIPKLSNLLKTAIDSEKPVIMGHGYGAFVTQLLSGMVINRPSGMFRSKQIPWTAAIMLDPYGPGVLGITETSYDNVKIPFICAVGERTSNVHQQDVQKRASIYFTLKETRKYVHAAYYLKGGDAVFNGIDAVKGGDDKKRHDDFKVVTNMFLKSYVEHNQKIFYELYGDKFLERLGSGNMKLFSK